MTKTLSGSGPLGNLVVLIGFLMVMFVGLSSLGQSASNAVFGFALLVFMVLVLMMLMGGKGRTRFRFD